MSESGHTQGEWTIGEENVGSGFNIYCGPLRVAHTSILARIFKPDQRPIAEDEAKANARRIVRAVNSFDDMLEALRILLAAHETAGAGASIFQLTTDDVRRIRAAVAKAEGKS